MLEEFVEFVLIRIILDCIELFIQWLLVMFVQLEMWFDYKYYNIWKLFVGVILNG